MKKKAQGLSMNTIIIAALAILVLILIALIFTGRIRLFRQGVEDCQSQGGQCKDACSDEYETQFGLDAQYCPADKYPNDPICCVGAT